MNTGDVIQLYAMPNKDGSDVIEYETNEQRIVRLLNENIIRSMQDMAETMRAETERIAAMLPADKHGREVKVGCMVHLDHNGRDRRVTVLDYAGNGTWIVGCDEGGSFLLPQSRDNVTVLAGDGE